MGEHFWRHHGSLVNLEWCFECVVGLLEGFGEQTAGDAGVDCTAMARVAPVIARNIFVT